MQNEGHEGDKTTPITLAVSGCVQSRPEVSSESLCRIHVMLSDESDRDTVCAAQGTCAPRRRGDAADVPRPPFPTRPGQSWAIVNATQRYIAPYFLPVEPRDWVTTKGVLKGVLLLMIHVTGRVDHSRQKINHSQI